MRVWPRPIGGLEPARRVPARRRAGRVLNVLVLPPRHLPAKPKSRTRRKVRSFRRDRCNFCPSIPYLRANNSFFALHGEPS